MCNRNSVDAVRSIELDIPTTSGDLDALEQGTIALMSNSAFSEI